MELPSVTLEQVLAFDPCYERARIERLAAGRPRMDALEILTLDIPIHDRLVTVLRPELLPEEVLGGLACDFAEHALRWWEAGVPGSRIPHEAVAVKRRWVLGEVADAELERVRLATLEASRGTYFEAQGRPDGLALQAAARAAYAAYRAAAPERVPAGVAACAVRVGYAAAKAAELAAGGAPAYARECERQADFIRQRLLALRLGSHG